ncbi:MAG TPA: hypothetical protein VH639_26380 [Bryobacteraceae bacterium]|jgi:hypothetical protein
MKRKRVLIRVAAGLCFAAALAYTVVADSTSATASLTSGKAQLMSAGALAFGPDGVLFVGDSVGGAVVALDTKDSAAPRSAVNINVQGVDAKLAALAGVTADQIMVNDVKVNPISKNVYLSASRGRGPDAMPLIARVNASGDVSLLSLDNIPHSSVSLTDAPAASPAGTNPRQNQRMSTITDMNYVNGNVMVAGLSNEEWSSALRSIPFPFKTASLGATLQIWHSSHGRYETQSPVRTFVPYTIQGQQYVLAAYTCTPLVKIPVSDLKPGAKVKGVTIADLGAGNQPLDMVPYKKNGHDFILVANTSFGVVKLKADNLETYKPIDSPTVTDVAGVPYDSISSVKNVQHLAQLDNTSAVVLTGKGPVNIQTIALP